MIQTPFWSNNINVLYQKDSFLEIFPFRQYDLVRKLNAIFRLSIYYAIFMILYNKDYNNLYVPIICGVLTYIIYYRYKDTYTDYIQTASMNDQLDDIIKVNDLQSSCRVPTKNNPFMNPQLNEYSNDKLPQPASCPSYNNKGVQKRVEDLFEQGLYKDFKDVFNKNNSQRQFYTVPGKTVPNDQGSFVQWCYGSPPTCKEGNGIACTVNNNSGGSPGVPAPS
tara:strand:- start:2310 stop:2975 length:666 start_codon:yes stop_codon:yes gene_type:complete